MRVAIFVDGKNFHSGFRASLGAQGARLDFPRMANWLTEQVGGGDLWGAHYYTGIERGDGAQTAGQIGLAKFLQMLETQPGYFVHRFPRKVARRTCPKCGEEIRFSHEKEVDTTMVADMLRLAAVDGFDKLVLVSGDADLAPAVENVRDLGKKVYVATWGRSSLAARLRQVAFDHIDLERGLSAFSADKGAGLTPGEALVATADLPVPTETTEASSGRTALDATPPAPETATTARAALMLEIERAEQKFAGGYVGVSYFIRRWRSNVLDESPEVRQRLLDALIGDGKAEIYEAPDGSKAIRRRSEP